MKTAILIDLGGVLLHDHLPAAAEAWGDRLGITPHEFLGALFGGNDETVLVAGVPDLADAVVLSCETGCAKPDPRIFEIALRRAGAAAGDALFIDDTPGHVEAARALGMSAHLHTDTAATIARISGSLKSHP